MCVCVCVCACGCVCAHSFASSGAAVGGCGSAQRGHTRAVNQPSVFAVTAHGQHAGKTRAWTSCFCSRWRDEATGWNDLFLFCFGFFCFCFFLRPKLNQQPGSARQVYLLAIKKIMVFYFLLPSAPHLLPLLLKAEFGSEVM